MNGLLYRMGQARLGERAGVLVRATRHLLPTCLREAKRHPDDADAGYRCVTLALDLVDDLQTYLTGEWKPEGYAGHLWVHTAHLPDPVKGEDQHAIIKEGVLKSAAKYLSMPWLSCGYLDWVYLDALVRWEVVAYEFDVHKARNPLPLFPASWLMSWLVRGGFGVVIEAAIAVAVAWWLHSEYSTDAPYRNVWGFCAATYYTFWAINTVRQIRRNRKAKIDAAAANASIDKLMAAMKWCYQQLNAPVLDPTRVREEFRKAEEFGASWPSAVGPLFENAIRRDPAIWITDRP